MTQTSKLSTKKGKKQKSKESNRLKKQNNLIKMQWKEKVYDLK